jgi:ribose 1,5-bisphosphate isomerase
MGYRQIVNDIISLKIQGAENVAKEAVKSLVCVVDESKAKTSKDLLKELHAAKDELFSTRPTEPCMRNALEYIFAHLPKQKESDIVRTLIERVNGVLKDFADSNKKIIEFGANKIKNGMVIYTHCHSSTVVKILLEAKRQGKKFEVHNTETRPLFQGRKTATELAAAGIPVTLYVDSAMRLALRKADLALIGADAISTEGKVVNKIGSELAAQICTNFDVPFYCCTNSWKFDPKTLFGFDEKIEMRHKKEVWDKPPKGVGINNYAFESVDSVLITGIISELGIYKSSVFIEELRRAYSWMFN